MQTIRQIAWAVILAVGLVACSGQAESESIDDKPDVVATTGLIADVVGQVAGDRVAVITLMKPGQDSHTFQPTAADVARLQEADLVFANGLDLEESLVPVLEELEADGKVHIIYVSDGVDVLPGGHHHHEDEVEHLDEHEHEAENEHAAGDPHTWMDPNSVMIWADNIASALADIDSPSASVYRANADAYKVQLAALDTLIAEQVDAIPQADRKLVTDHEALGYFAHRYGFEMIGAVIPNVSTSAEPSAADLAALVTAMREQNVRAIFVETAVSDAMARQVASEVGYPVQILPLYHDLGDRGSGADTYLTMMRVNIKTIMSGLAPGG